MIRNSTGCSLDHKGTQHVRFVIALSGRSLRKYDYLGCAMRVLEYISDKRRLMLTGHQTLPYHLYGWLIGT
jgi:hypothetical protein